jgi:glycosidase
MGGPGLSAASVAHLDFGTVTPGGKTPSPSAWEDEVLYFLLVDRFFDGNEDGHRDLANGPVSGTTPIFAPTDNGNVVTTKTNAAAWRQSGVTFVGGSLAGIRSKLGYLTRLRITALWISPILKQTHPAATYHGYATTKTFLRSSLFRL